ncbi:hypothetical protein [Corynebacterium callunae]|uniref:Major tail protein n=1 Tax=Corynebacterium callunae DSM 20147 TaxID=1121353 RepID=M1TRF3_9CORY|nr:hypothetical protein [Corynebacterium callunae]AGG66876.1 hypothetical protein H924_07170 [Corynebacterium callunae DSM 20147]MCK2200180.1 hypothetical protein [Corynebacterium callunae]
MTVNVMNAFVGRPPIEGGVFYAGPAGAALPTDATTLPGAEFEDHGAVGPDGINVTQNRSTSDERMFGGGVFVDLQTEFDETVEVVLMEDDNDAVLKSSFGDANVVKTAATDSSGTTRTIYHTDEQLPIRSFVIRTASGDKKKTYVIERGRVSTVVTTPDAHGASTKRTLTIKTFKPLNTALKGGHIVEYRNDGAVLASGG